MNKAVERGRFLGFDFDQSCSFSNAGDTLLVDRASFDNLWVIKAVFRGFEMVLGLKVTFHKSCLFGLNVDDDFFTAGSSFLCCKTGYLPFMYLGLPIGAN